jgi:hypothetical protein
MVAMENVCQECLLGLCLSKCHTRIMRVHIIYEILLPGLFGVIVLVEIPYTLFRDIVLD